jgi:hypothetical protein
LQRCRNAETPEQGRAHDADLLKLSEKTVEFHKRHIMEAFHLENNAALDICLEGGIDFAKALTVLREYRHRSGYESRFHQLLVHQIFQSLADLPLLIFA